MINQGTELHCLLVTVCSENLSEVAVHNVNTSYLLFFSSLSLESHTKEISALFIKSVRALYVLLKKSNIVQHIDIYQMYEDKEDKAKDRELEIVYSLLMIINVTKICIQSYYPCVCSTCLLVYGVNLRKKNIYSYIFEQSIYEYSS